MGIRRVPGPPQHALADAVVIAPLISELAGALKHPTRIAVLMQLRDGERYSPTDLSERFDQPLGVVSYHVRRLAQDGFLQRAGTKPVRGAVIHYYRLSQKGDNAVKAALLLAKEPAIDGR